MFSVVYYFRFLIFLNSHKLSYFKKCLFFENGSFFEKYFREHYISLIASWGSDSPAQLSKRANPFEYFFLFSCLFCSSFSCLLFTFMFICYFLFFCFSSFFFFSFFSFLFYFRLFLKKITFESGSFFYLLLFLVHRYF